MICRAAAFWLWEIVDGEETFAEIRPMQRQPKARGGLKRFILTPRAQQDIDDIWEYIAGDTLGAADLVVDAKAMVKLAKSPRLGHSREELSDPASPIFSRLFYLIVYRHEAAPNYPCSPRGSRCAEHTPNDARVSFADCANSDWLRPSPKPCFRTS